MCCSYLSCGSEKIALCVGNIDSNLIEHFTKQKEVMVLFSFKDLLNYFFVWLLYYVCLFCCM